MIEITRFQVEQEGFVVRKDSRGSVSLSAYTIEDNGFWSLENMIEYPQAVLDQVIAALQKAKDA